MQPPRTRWGGDYDNDDDEREIDDDKNTTINK